MNRGKSGLKNIPLTGGKIVLLYLMFHTILFLLPAATFAQAGQSELVAD